MAAIVEWFSAYGLMFEHVKKNFGENAVNDYCDFLGKRLHGYLDYPSGDRAKTAMAEYFSKNIPKDEGKCSIENQEDLTVNIELCPDHLYFSKTPYESQRHDERYCEYCVRVHDSIGKSSGLKMEHTGPKKKDGQFNCKFKFSVKGD